jgi:hypothetical protein
MHQTLRNESERKENVREETSDEYKGKGREAALFTARKTFRGETN